MNIRTLKTPAAMTILEKLLKALMGEEPKPQPVPVPVRVKKR